MSFPSLEDPVPVVDVPLTNQQKAQIVDAFAEGKSKNYIRYTYGLSKEKINTIFDKLLSIYNTTIEYMDENPTATLVELKAGVSSQYALGSQVIEYVVDKIIETVTTEGTWTSFAAKFPRSVEG